MKSRKKINILIFAGIFFIVFLAYIVGNTYYQHLFISENKKSYTEKVYKYQFVMIVDSPDSQFWQSVYEKAAFTAEENNAILEMRGTEWGREYNKIDFMEMGIAAGVDGIILEYNGEEELDKLINKAVIQGIPVVTVMNDAPLTMRNSFVGVSDYQMSLAYGEQVAEYVDEATEDIMVLMKRNEADQSQICNQIGNEAENKIERVHEINVESKNLLSFGSFEIEEAVRDIFQQAGGPPDILVCMDEEITECARQALIDYNMAGQVKIIGYYISENILDAIKKGLISETCYVDTEQLGKYSIEALTEYLTEGRASSYYNVDINFLNMSEVDKREFKEGLDGAN